MRKRQAKRKWKRRTSATSKLYDYQRFLARVNQEKLSRKYSFFFFTAPVSEKQETMDENPDINNHPELKQGIRQFLLEIVEQYYEKDDDLIVLQNMNDDPPQVDYINEVKKKSDGYIHIK